MKLLNIYILSCDCGAIELTVTGTPRITNYCHCQSCRELLNVPFYAGTAWNESDVSVTKGEEHLFVFKHPQKMMSRYHCRTCGAIMFNTDRFNFRCISYSLFRKSNNELLHKELMPTCHQFYEERVIDVEDALPKYLKSLDGDIFKRETQFVPVAFNVPVTAQSTYFKLQPLTIHNVFNDYDAVMMNREYLWQRFGKVWGWPATDLSLEQDLIDLAWHQKEFQMQSTFAYTVLSLDEAKVLGCVYVYPPLSADADAQVWYWARQDYSPHDLERELGIFLMGWLLTRWSFETVFLNNVKCKLGQ